MGLERLGIDCASRKLVSVLNENEMKVTDYYFDLPQEQIAQDPAGGSVILQTSGPR